MTKTHDASDNGVLCASDARVIGLTTYSTLLSTSATGTATERVLLLFAIQLHQNIPDNTRDNAVGETPIKNKIMTKSYARHHDERITELTVMKETHHSSM